MSSEVKLFQEFDKDMDKFDAVMEDLDSRLASIACGAFENCSSVEARFKVSLV